MSIAGYKIEIPINPDKGFSVIDSSGRVIAEFDTFDECKSMIKSMK